MAVSEFETIRSEFEELIYTKMKSKPQYELLQIPAKKLFLQRDELVGYLDSDEAVKLSIQYSGVDAYLAISGTKK